jgi:hypothetical protein
MSGQLVIYGNNLQVEEDSGPASFWLVTHAGHPYINVASKNSDDHYETHRFGPSDVTAFAIRTAPDFIAFMGGNDSGDIWAADALTPLHMTRQGVLTMGRKTLPGDGEMAVPHKGYVDDKTKTVAGMCDDRFVGPNGGTWAKVAGARGRATPGVTIDVDGTYHVPPGLYNISMQGSNDVGFDRFVLSYDIDGWNGYGSSGQWICDHRASAGENGSGSQLVVVQESIAFYIYVLAGGSQGVNMRGQFARVGDAF